MTAQGDEDSMTVAAISGVVIYHGMQTGDYRRDDETLAEYVARQFSLLRAALGTVRP